MGYPPPDAGSPPTSFSGVSVALHVTVCYAYVQFLKEWLIMTGLEKRVMLGLVEKWRGRATKWDYHIDSRIQSNHDRRVALDLERTLQDLGVTADGG